MKKFIPLFIVLFIASFGCKTTQQIPIHDSTTVEQTETVEDTYTYTEVDSILYSFLFECDSNYQVLLKEYESVNTGIKDKVEIKEVIRWRTDNTKVTQLSVNIQGLIDSIAIRDRTIERLKNRVEIREIPVEVVKEVTKNSPFAKFCIKFFFVALIAGIVYVIIKFKLYKFVLKR